MLLTLDINLMAEQVIKERNQPSFFLRFLYFIKTKVVKRINRDLDSFILSLEGAYKHAEELDTQSALSLLKDTKIVITKLDSFDEKLMKDNYLDDEQLKQKLKYLLNALYKFESILHKTSYQDAPFLKTPEEISEGISKLNQRNFSRASS